ncbi:MAG: cytochrome C oxidase subunit IV family protein [Acidimicrobiia bacterium]
MSEATAVLQADSVSDEHKGKPFQYVMIAIALMVVTALEVALYYVEKDHPDVAKAAIVVPLLALAASKFAIVVLFFMHLKHDQPIFKRYFVLGLSAAFVLYLVVLSSLRIFG